MPRFLVEVPHDEEVVACAYAVQALLRTGSHFVSHADWGCKDGVHKAWFVAEVESKAEARAIVPVPFRTDVEVTQLNVFTLEEIEELLQHHQGKAGH